MASRCKICISLPYIAREGLPDCQGRPGTMTLPKSGSSQATKTQKAHPSGWALHVFDAWQFPTLTWGDPTLPSALRRFTSEFGMGSGGTTALSPPGKFCCQKRIFYTDAALAAFVKSVTYLSMLLPLLHLPPCLSVKSFVPENL